MGKKESEVVTEVRAYLKELGIPHARINTGGIKVGRNYIHLLPEGVSDIVGFFREKKHKGLGGIILAVEVKAPGREPSEAQEEFLALVREAGGFATWVDNVEKLKEELGKYLKRSNSV